jgi:nicotinamide-nucleotide amidase
VGTVWIALASVHEVGAQCFHFDGDRKAVREATLHAGLDSLLERLIACDIQG